MFEAFGQGTEKIVFGIGLRQIMQDALGFRLCWTSA